ncbi:PTS sugar transporter subunit IIA [Paramicrobacterium chengjingii]|uniref:Ascorbate-specific PTS system EIIA component n=1 Tax=Paramicrobacterium chengjingii TaxID=2769067 RepID=A0ABX6YHK0_9MICO|nr:PTS sugar transporter subunit IIA [Microbacterium chengjingii]QPZ38074.1 PTS sugar transporter subunit IIA [Microbacterium chengjingii]
MGLADQLPDSAVFTQTVARDWRDAIRWAGRGLANQGVTTDRYTEEMLKAVDDHGPYIVVAPGFALAHSRPSDAVLRKGLSWVSLKKPVDFGSESNDPVSLVVGLAATDHEEHLAVMAELAEVLSHDDVLAELMSAETADEIRAILRRVASSEST